MRVLFEVLIRKIMRGGSGVVESSVIVERVDDVDKEKKKKRRSNRRSKHNSGIFHITALNFPDKSLILYIQIEFLVMLLGIY